MKKHYATPTLKVVEFKSECGFATSGFTARSLESGGMEFEMIFDADEGPCNEQYTFDDGTTFWN